jgi:hypothetical protein
MSYAGNVDKTDKPNARKFFFITRAEGGVDKFPVLVVRNLPKAPAPALGESPAPLNEYDVNPTRESRVDLLAVFGVPDSQGIPSTVYLKARRDSSRQSGTWDDLSDGDFA